MELNSRSNDCGHAEPAMAGDALAPIIEFLLQHALYDRMAPTQLEFVARYLTPGFYAKGEVITKHARCRGVFLRHQALSGAYPAVRYQAQFLLRVCRETDLSVI